MADKTFLDTAGLNYIDIKYNLINFLKSQSEFSDYNFEGSNLSVLIDLLAYNASQQGFYNTMVANEMFIDRAAKRSSVVSIAKSLGYVPYGKKAAKAKVLVTVAAEDLPTNRLLTKGTTFTGKKTLDGMIQEFTFSATDSHGFIPYEYSEDGSTITSYICGPVTLIQGVYNTTSFNAENYAQKFIIQDKNTDKDSIRVYVTESITDMTGINYAWSLCKDITNVDENSKVFFIEENELGQYQIYFGDGVLGKKIDVGNIIVVEYVSTVGVEGNNVGINDSSTSSSFVSDDNYSVITLEYSNSGAERESTTTIKKNAIRNYTSKERAVTAKDYEGMALSAYNDNIAVRCWGGEDNDPPYYGKVFMSIRPIGSVTLTSEEKQNFITNILKEKNIVGIDVVLVDPEVLYVNCNSTIYYDKNYTNISPTTLTQLIKSGLITYFTNSLIEFGDSVFAMDVETTVKNTNPAIKAVDVEFTLSRRITPTFGVEQRVIVDFQNELYHPVDGSLNILTSSKFKLLNKDHYIEEDGYGNLILKQVQADGSVIITNSDYGTINYTTGKLEIPALKLDSYSNLLQYLEFTVKPSTNNIFAKRNSVLFFESTNSKSLTTTLVPVKQSNVSGGSGTVIEKPNL